MCGMSQKTKMSGSELPSPLTGSVQGQVEFKQVWLQTSSEKVLQNVYFSRKPGGGGNQYWYGSSYTYCIAHYTPQYGTEQ